MMKILSDSGTLWDEEGEALQTEGPKFQDMALKDDSLTPIMLQYQEAKDSNKECLVLFQIGDFFELFYNDAVEASEALNITLTHRRQGAEKIPMCGVPLKSYEVYIQRLVEAGFKVALCPQLETPQQAKRRGSRSLVQREVTQVFTQGTLREDVFLSPEKASYLFSFCLSQDKKKIGAAWVDISTGEFFTRYSDADNFESMLSQILPQEILIREKDLQHPPFFEIYAAYKKRLTSRLNYLFDLSTAQRHLADVLGEFSLDVLSEQTKEEMIAAGVVAEYIRLTQKTSLPHIRLPKKLDDRSFVQIDSGTFRNLEILRSVEGTTTGSLFGTVKRTLTPEGTRLLQEFLCRPLLSKDDINTRLDMVDFLLAQPSLRTLLQKTLKGTPDTLRLLGRLPHQRNNPHNVVLLGESLRRFEVLGVLEAESKISSPPLAAVFKNFAGFSDLHHRIKTTLREDAPTTFKSGKVVREDYSQEINGLNRKLKEIKDKIPLLQERYIARYGTPSLKIRHNNILGYFIEVSSKQAEKIPLALKEPQAPDETEHRLIHRQSLTASIRYITQHLINLQTDLEQTAAQIDDMEKEIFENLLEEILEQNNLLVKAAESLAFVDVMLSFAALAHERGFCRPVLEETKSLFVQNGRHPVVEEFLFSKKQGDFIRNDCRFDSSMAMWLITGPNMAGKSTFLRQIALIVLLAQIGCFVPADSAIIGLVDKIFSRVGASDNLARGQSTFMVEMIESARILNQATEKSLVLLDEIGRGTSTWDGLSIAWAIAEYFLSSIQCRSFFATHYHELTELANRYPSLRNYTVAVEEKDNQIIFLHKITEGIAQRSYGIHVAQLAGLPASVTTRAYQILFALEQKAPLPKETPPGLVLPEEEKRALHNLKQINIDDLSPRDALDFLYKIKKSLS